jgi:hypothetical protein
MAPNPICMARKVRIKESKKCGAFHYFIFWFLSANMIGTKRWGRKNVYFWVVNLVVDVAESSLAPKSAWMDTNSSSMLQCRKQRLDNR